MRWSKRIRLFLRALVLRKRVEAELDEELRYHIDREAQEGLNRGLTSVAAERAASLCMSGLEQQKELCREARRTLLLENLLRDLRYALRVFSRSPSFALVVVVTLAVGIGANAAIFSLIEATVLRPLPNADADRLVALSEADREGNDLMVSWPDFVDWESDTTGFSAMAALGGVNLNLTGQGQAERLHGLRVSFSFLSVLGVHPLLGRDFLRSDDRPSAVPVAMLSNELWRRRFGGDASVLGRTIELDGRAFAVIGVLAPNFRFLYARDIYIPIGLEADKAPNRGVRSVARVLARLKPGTSIEMAGSELRLVAGRPEAAYPGYDRGVQATIRPFAEMVAAPARRGLLTLSIGVGFLLLIACANVASLLLSRASSREREIAVRVAVGATRTRLVSQLMTESGLLSFAGAVLGCGLAAAVLPTLALLVPMDQGEMQQYVRPALNMWVLSFTIGLTVFTTVLVGLVPALRASSDTADPLRSGLRATATGFRKLSFRSALVATQIALSVMLLMGAGLLLQSLLRLQKMNLGFEPNHLITARLKLPSVGYKGVAERALYFRRLIDRLDGIPSVLKASGATCLPFTGKDCWPSVFAVEGQFNSSENNLKRAHFNAIATGYLKTMQIPLLQGRELSEKDDTSHERVILINQAFSRQFFPHVSPLGKRILEGYGANQNAYRIVGVVGDARRESPDVAPESEVFLPLAAVGPDALELVIRTNLKDPQVIYTDISRAVRALDPDVPVYDLRSMQWYLTYQTANRRFPTLLLTAFAAIATSLAAIGLYGLISYFVVQRRKEWGIRIALGAESRDVVATVMKQGLQLVAAGLVAGLAGAWALTRFLQALLFATRANDMATLAGICGVIIAVALFACWLPAHRAATVDPALTLRADQ